MTAVPKLIRIAGLLLLVGMVLFPPWKIAYTQGPEHTAESASIGYHALWYRIETEENDPRENVQQRIDIVRLAVQLGVVLVLTNLILLAAARGSRARQ